MNERHMTILAMLAEGKRDKQIADAMNMQTGAVRAVIHRAVEAMGAKTRCHAVALYVKQVEDDGYV